MRPVRRAKSIVHIHVAPCRQLLGKFRIILFLLRVPTHIFQQQRLSGLERGDRGLGGLSHAVWRERYLLAEELREARCGGS